MDNKGLLENIRAAEAKWLSSDTLLYSNRKNPVSKDNRALHNCSTKLASTARKGIGIGEGFAITTRKIYFLAAAGAAAGTAAGSGLAAVAAAGALVAGAAAAGAGAFAEQKSSDAELMQ